MATIIRLSIMISMIAVSLVWFGTGLCNADDLLIPVYTGYSVVRGQEPSYPSFTVFSYYEMNLSDYINHGSDAKAMWDTRMKVFSTTSGLTDVLSIDRITNLRSIPSCISISSDYTVKQCPDYLLVDQVGGRFLLYRITNEGRLQELLSFCCTEPMLVSTLVIPNTDQIGITIPEGTLVYMSDSLTQESFNAEPLNTGVLWNYIVINPNSLSESLQAAVSYCKLSNLDQ